MKKLENQTVFQCSYCSKISKSAAGIYQHERFCKKNPHNQLLCTSCAHCHKEEHVSEPGERCKTCDCGKSLLDECIFFDDDCGRRIKYTDFICDIDGSKMYALNKIRLKTSFEEIKNRCDKPMVDATQQCENYEYNDKI